jgi:hypothetical protein
MYNIGLCKICKQGLLEIVKDEERNKIYICCDECEAEWDLPSDALCPKNGTRGKYGKIIYPSLSEINKLNWDVDIFEHHN